MAKVNNLKHYALFVLIIVSYFGLAFLAAKNVTKLPIKTDNFFGETDKIKDGLNMLVDMDCKNEKGEHCGQNHFTVMDIVADKNNSYSTGTGKTDNGISFWWVAAKNDGYWNDMMLVHDGDEIKCNEIPAKITEEIFKEKLRYCVDENGKKVDRTKLFLSY